MKDTLLCLTLNSLPFVRVEEELSLFSGAGSPESLLSHGAAVYLVQSSSDSAAQSCLNRKPV